MPKQKPIRIRLDFTGAEADQFLSVKGHLGVKNDTEVVRSLLNRYWREHKDELEPALQHYNLSEEGVLVLDRSLKPHRIIQVLFKPEGFECELCESKTCKHVQFVLSLPEVNEILERR